jgi:hypothetical protein
VGFLMIRTLRDLINTSSNITRDRPAVVFGSAPSIRSLRRNAFTGVKIGVGDMPWRAPEFDPFDFWVTSNTYYPLTQEQKHLRDMIDSTSIILISPECVQNTQSDLSVKLIQLKKIIAAFDFVLYDQRHFGNLVCKPQANCCKFVSHFNIDVSIQELLNELASNDFSPYGLSHTVASHRFALAVLLGFNPIYIAGVELPEKNKNYKAYNNFKNPIISFKGRIHKILTRFEKSDFFGSARSETLQDFYKIAKIAKIHGAKVFCLSKTSPLLQISGIDYMSPKIFNHIGG